jgi:glutaredoxin
MPKPLLAALGAIASLFFAAAASAQLYRWVDKDGKVHYTDTPPPASAGKSAQLRSGAGSTVDTSALPYATQQAMRNFPVTLYTAEVCKELCSSARQFLQSRGIPFREVAVNDEKSREELKKISGDEEVPVLAVGKIVRKGFGADNWHAALDTAGYPRSGPPLAAQGQKPEASAPAAKAPAAPAEPPKPGPYAPR